MSHTLIIIPTYNEKDNIDLIFSKIFDVVPEVSVLVVDDNSEDGTASLVREWMERKPSKVFILEREGKLGLGSAYIAGFKWALSQDYQHIIEMDADLSHNPDHLPKMIATLGEAQVAIGSRYVEGGGTVNWGVIRKIISRFGSFYARTILGTPAYDLTGGFNGWQRQVLENIGLNEVKSEGYAFQIELKHRAFRLGFSLKEFPIIFEDRRVGQSKMSSGIVFEALYRVWQIRFLTSSLSPQSLASPSNPS